MPSPPSTPNQKPKPALAAPTFKYGSNTYVVLAYAKVAKRPFGIRDIRSFTARYTNDYEVGRSLSVLEKNLSVKKVNQDQWEITQTGIQHIYDFARRKNLSLVHGD